MDKFPYEIISAIANKLDLPVDVANFRLVNHVSAAAALACQARHITVLNTSESLQDFVAFLECSPSFARHTRELSIYHGTWPICSRKAWEVHPLRENAIDLDWDHYSTEADTAYGNYRKFISKEARREPATDMIILQRILRFLPRLQRIKVGHVQNWNWNSTSCNKYLRLQRKIWISAFFNDTIGEALGLILPTLNSFSQIQDLEIRGTLDPAEIYSCKDTVMTYIKRLEIGSLLVFAESQQPAASLLRSFPNIQQLSVRLAFNGMHTCMLLHDIYWPQLQEIELRNIWVTYSDLKSLLLRHTTLQKVTIKDTTLTTGTWKEICEIAKLQRSRIDLEFDGVLCSLNPGMRIDIKRNVDQSYLLSQYLNEYNFPWPFQ